MKTAKDWAATYDKEFGELDDSAEATVGEGVVPFVDIHEILIRRIQLDAIKEGMRRAAKIIRQYQLPPRMDSVIAVEAIAEQLTEKDL